jgi:hypothetical protein
MRILPSLPSIGTESRYIGHDTADLHPLTQDAESLTASSDAEALRVLKVFLSLFSSCQVGSWRMGARQVARLKRPETAACRRRPDSSFAA